MRACHPNGVQGHRPINTRKANVKQRKIGQLQKFLKQPAK